MLVIVMIKKNSFYILLLNFNTKKFSNHPEN